MTTCKTIEAYNRHLIPSIGSFYMPKRAFKDRLFQARQAKGMREGRTVEQTELAKAVGVSPQSWSNWEDGVEPNYERLPLIARALGTTVGWLVAEEGSPPATTQPVKAPPVRLTPSVTSKTTKRRREG